MKETIEKCRKGAKLLGVVSVQMMLGGLVAAVVPPHVSMLYKAAAYIGSCVAAACINEPVNRVVDKQIEEIQAVIDQSMEYVNTLMQEDELTEEG